MAKRTLAILSVSAGAGHVRAAQALEAAAEADPDDVEAVHLDVMELVPKLFKKLYVDAYLHISDRHPTLWGYLYGHTDRNREDPTLASLRRAFQRLNTRKLSRRLREIDPDAVICTHFLPAELLSRRIRKGKFNRPVWVQVTDFDIHRFWIHKHMIGYFAGNEEVAWRMADRGIPADSVHVTGIPVMPAFSAKLSREKCARELGARPDRLTILMMSGGQGLGSVRELAERLLTIEGDFQLFVLAGRNEKLLAGLQALATQHAGRLFPMGFTNTVERVMAASDLAVTKPGGLTSSECLAMGLPMIIVSPIPGQEERNADYLLEGGAALKAYDAAGLELRVRKLIQAPERLASLRESSRRMGRPHAARDVLRIVLDALDAAPQAP